MGSTSTATAKTGRLADTGGRAGKYLTFHLDREEFGIQVFRVREIISVIDIVAVPDTPDFVKGVINLRGKVTPVIDLRRKFAMEEAEGTQRTCIIVVQVNAENTSVLMGVLVDAVSEVANFTEADIVDTPDFGGGVTAPFLLGMAKAKGKVKLLLDIDSVLSPQELASLEAAI